MSIGSFAEKNAHRARKPLQIKECADCGDEMEVTVFQTRKKFCARCSKIRDLARGRASRDSNYKPEKPHKEEGRGMAFVMVRCPGYSWGHLVKFDKTDMRYNLAAGVFVEGTVFQYNMGRNGLGPKRQRVRVKGPMLCPQQLVDKHGEVIEI